MEQLIQIDQSLFLFLNSLHASWLDSLMWWLSDKLIWMPLYLLILGLIIKNYGWKAITILFFVALLIAASDQISVWIKFSIQRARPTHTEGLKESIHTLNNYFGGAYGFVSSHAANSFALASFTSFFLQTHYKYYGIMAFVWAFLVSYSRIYLGVHFPGDIIGGAVLGIFLSLVVYKLYSTFTQRCANNYC
ncbi:MAG: phosphatase PAP2 family protein [Bacteroidetes bacterium 4572_77]|nr:MAG: phosphatase PAP2 family protein [Bacteroidetes bacterium 4572_77]